MAEVLFRPMRPDDVPVAERLSDESFLELDRRVFRRDQPDPRPRTADHRAGWIARTLHFLETDPGGCWVADADGEMVGFATSIRREGTWILATYAVSPGQQGRGLGKQVLDRALTHSRGCLQGMLSASDDPRAVRRYLLAGFTMHPQMFLSGTVDRSAIPDGTGSRIREGTAADTELMDSVDRRARGAAHGPDHALMQRIFRWVVSDTTAGSGYAYLTPTGAVALLAATNRRTAEKLLWSAIADGPDEQTVSHVTAANDWAIAVGTAARLDLRTSGYLALRGLRPPTTYLHNGALL
ncbi:GNAT family N-acetyltransferase [Nocardioides sp.]|uniref:GNAT family N-acetyltransferase n=1 Tax=Nocardioides sp. TaxID=35761 RepID=UPI0027247B6D|nr:GNAT family N-acetyltransferase [Nocardioides sp.]MDO9455828.1 GNAT family N-acetyltransferase [Nocardioides sp.]